VAPRYDQLNHLLSASLDRFWRRRAARLVEAADGPVLDLCCGTGDQAVALARRGPAVAAADFCLPMLSRARPKFANLTAPRPVPLAADALALPFPSGAFGAATVSFGLRNVADLERVLEEIARILRAGGRLVVLEFAMPVSPLVRRGYEAYFRGLLPRLGRWISRHPTAYSYLSVSVPDFPQRGAFVERLAAAGFVDGRWRDLAAGIVCLYHARKP